VLSVNETNPIPLALSTLATYGKVIKGNSILDAVNSKLNKKFFFKVAKKISLKLRPFSHIIFS
jgi:capsular polysaccharide biosynthesis protein